MDNRFETLEFSCLFLFLLWWCILFIFHVVWVWTELDPFQLTRAFVVLFCFSMIWLSQICDFGSINLKGIQADNPRNVVPPSSRSASNYVALRFCNFNLDANVRLCFILFSLEHFVVYRKSQLTTEPW